jgi:drug/metabolite transporter (DMT)-like permease
MAPFFYAGMACSAKLAGEYLNVWQLGVGRFALGLLVIPVVVRILGLSLWGNRRFMLSLRGLCGGAAFLLLVASFKTISLTLAMVLFYLYPAFTALLSPWVTGDPTEKRAWPFILGAFAGTTIILWPAETGSTGLNIGHFFAMIASVLCALTLLLVRRLGRDNNIYTLFFYLCLAGTLAGLGPLLLQEGPRLPAFSSAWIMLGFLAVFSIGAQLSINQALLSIPAPRVSVIMTAEVPIIACFGVFYLGEPLGWRLIAGALLIFGCGIGLHVQPGTSKETDT